MYRNSVLALLVILIPSLALADDANDADWSMPVDCYFTGPLGESEGFRAGSYSCELVQGFGESYFDSIISFGEVEEGSSFTDEVEFGLSNGFGDGAFPPLARAIVARYRLGTTNSAADELLEIHLTATRENWRLSAHHVLADSPDVSPSLVSNTFDPVGKPAGSTWPLTVRISFAPVGDPNGSDYHSILAVEILHEGDRPGVGALIAIPAGMEMKSRKLGHLHAHDMPTGEITIRYNSL